MFDGGGFDPMFMMDGPSDSAGPGGPYEPYTWKQILGMVVLVLLGVAVLLGLAVALCYWTGGTDCCPFFEEVCSPDWSAHPRSR